jgi:lipid II:glycine glycyltransferase (peptidoglycan interpeptide bridge formation enzyme)
MEVREIKEKNIWDEFISECRNRTFLQSFNWGECQKNGGEKIWRLGFFNGDVLVGAALVLKVSAKRGTFLLIQHGPSVKEESFKKEVLEVLLIELRKIGEEEKADFIRMNPLWLRIKENQDILKELGFREAPMHASAYESTWKLNIEKTEEELLADMRKTTRYLLRQASKNQDIVISKSESPGDVQVYQKLNQEVAKRHGFVPFSLESVDKEFKAFAKDGEAMFFFGKYKGEVAAASLIIFWSGIGFYHQAASSSRYAKLSIPYLLQWEAILEARRRGCKLYDFWGYVDPIKNPRHPWAGPTLFKMGFGGEGFEYVKTQDYPLTGRYKLIYIFEKLRKIKRGL